MVKPELIRHSLGLNSRLTQYVHGLDIPATERSRLANASFSFVMDCHSAISLLTNYKLYGPSAAMLRIIVEALLRGYWLYWCADEQRLQRMYDSPETHTDQIQQLFNDLNKSPKLSQGYYPRLIGFLAYHIGKCDQKDSEGRAQKSKRIWKALNSYTHGGSWQISNYQSEESVERSFHDDEVREVLQFSDCCLCWATMGVCETANKSYIANKIYNEFTEVLNT